MFAKWVTEDQRFAFSMSDNGGVEITDEYHQELLDAERNGGVLVPDPAGNPGVKQPTLGDLKADKKAWIEGERDKRLTDPTATVAAHGTTWQMDPVSKGELNDALTTYTAAAGTPPGFVWRDINNIDHPADLAFLTGIAVARGEQKAAIWQTSWVLKGQVDAATTEAELDAILW